VLLGSLAVVAAPAPQQGPVFRSTVDLIAVDVQVVDRDGVPVSAIGPEAFTVSINGRERRVVSAEFVRQASLDTIGLEPSRRAPALSAIVDEAEADEESAGRMFILAVDNGSFEAGSIRPAMEAAQYFVDSLEPNDRLGLYVYPTGPRIAPTTERAPIRTALSSVTGEKWSLRSRFNLQPSEIVDITAALGMGIQTRQNTFGIDPSAPPTAATNAVPLPPDWDAVLRVVRRECPGEVDCPSHILNEVASMAPHLENQVESSLRGLDELLRGLAGVPGRKNVVLVSAGILVSDRRDGRPDVGDRSRVMGQTAARANASVYTVQVETTGPSAVAGSRLPMSVSSRDRLMLGNWLDEFSTTAGGSRIYVPVGSGQFAFQRVLRETSAHYLLGVEPAETDRDGKPRQLRVRVDHPGVTVHGRQWVLIPTRSGSD
jgi:VWFA-related protein